MYLRMYMPRPMKSARAKVFQNGGSQAVRLPRECRFPDTQKEVLVRRHGRNVILELPDEWPAKFRACLGAWHEGIERPAQVPLAELARKRP